MKIHGKSGFRIPALAGLALTGMLGIVASGGGGGSSPDSEARVLTIYSDADYIACQDGSSGAWQAIQTNSAPGRHEYQCTIDDPDGKYGVMAATGAGTRPEVWIIQATLGEASKVSMPFDTTLPEASITFNVSNSTAGADITAFIGPEGDGIPLAGDGAHAAIAPAGYYDVLALQWDAGGNLLDFIQLQRGVTISDGVVLNLDFSQGISTADVFTNAFSAQGRGISWAEAFLLTSNHTLVPVGDTQDAQWSGLPANDLLPGDRYLFMASDTVSGMDATQNYEYVKTYNPASAPGDMMVDMSGKTAMTASSLTLNGATWPAYVPAADSPPLRAYVLSLEQTGTPSVAWDVIVSQAWLGQAGDYTYTLPATAALGLTTDFDFTTGVATDGMLGAVMFDVAAEAMMLVDDPIYLRDLHMETAAWVTRFTP